MRQTCIIEGCDRGGKLTRRMCSLHYQRWRHHGDPEWERPRSSHLALFVAKTEVDEQGCWLWIGAIGSVGYGKFKFHKVMDAHRASWLMHYGEIPEGAYVLHKCDVKRCVNPAHLFLGTHQDNMTDKVTKGRQGRGESIGNSILTTADVLEIRRLSADGTPYPVIARHFGVSVANVCLVVRRKTWKHVA